MRVKLYVVETNMDISNFSITRYFCHVSDCHLFRGIHYVYSFLLSSVTLFSEITVSFVPRSFFKPSLVYHRMRRSCTSEHDDFCERVSSSSSISRTSNTHYMYKIAAVSFFSNRRTFEKRCKNIDTRNTTRARFLAEITFLHVRCDVFAFKEIGEHSRARNSINLFGTH